ncbi:ThuA domain-containing protein [Bacteroidota bacterium]
MKKSISRIIPGLIVMILMLGIFSCTSQPQIKTLIVTGQNNHNIGGSSVAIKTILEKPGIFTVVTATSPQKGEDMSEFIIDFSPFDVVVLNYNGDDWPEETRENFVTFVENGGGVVVIHAANNAFPDWKEYNEITGLGGWGERDESAGPYLYVKDGEVISDDAEGRGGSHGQKHEFIVEAFQPGHPVMKGLPARWMHAEDELYQQLRGPAKNIEILATAYASKEIGGTERNEPVLFTVSYGEGRIFHTVLGHTNGNEFFAPSMECAGFITILQRGTEWAATGKVSQKVPDIFPDETKSISWKYFEPMDIKIISERIQDYEIGKSTNCIIALKEQINLNLNDNVKMDEIHEMILDVLSSGSASIEGKKILLKEFSWVATDTYKPVYEKLSTVPDLKDEALFALEQMSY